MTLKHTKWIAWAIIVLAILLRVVLLFQNRNLTLDEVNVVRNLHERGFLGLLSPLDYNQFAPPLFLWAEKTCSLLIGNREWAFRLFPFLCSVVSLVLFYKILLRIGLQKMIFYPLLVLATGMFFVRYATETKQYSSDILLSLGLLFLALRYGIGTTKPLKFVVVWVVALSIANWLSMPSIFIIASIGFYYLMGVLAAKNYRLLLPLSLAWLVYLAQFGLYYQYLLLPSISSDYLQHWHEQFFIKLTPFDVDVWRSNLLLLQYYFSAVSGDNKLSAVFNLIMLGVGSIYFIRRNAPLFVLLTLPILLLFLAAALHKYTLLPRVCLFSYPLLIIIIAQGIEATYYWLKNKYAKAILVIICLAAFFTFSKIDWAINAPRFEKTTESIDWLKSQNVKTVYIHSLVLPPMTYYTSIHPDSSQWKWFATSTLLVGNIDSLLEASPKHCAVVYNWMDEQELAAQKMTFNKFYFVSDSLISDEQYVFLLSRK